MTEMSKLYISVTREPQNAMSDLSGVLNFHSLSDEQFDIEIEKGIADLNAGRVTPAWKVKEDLKRRYN